MIRATVALGLALAAGLLALVVLGGERSPQRAAGTLAPRRPPARHIAATLPLPAGRRRASLLTWYPAGTTPMLALRASRPSRLSVSIYDFAEGRAFLPIDCHLTRRRPVCRRGPMEATEGSGRRWHWRITVVRLSSHPTTARLSLRFLR